VHVFLLSTMAGVTMSFHFVGNAAALPNNLVAGEVVKPDAAVNRPGKQAHKLSEVASTTTRNWLGFVCFLTYLVAVVLLTPDFQVRFRNAPQRCAVRRARATT
jgi:hypothetical protein